MAQNGDFLFLIDGMKQPSILRICDHHFDVIVLAMPPPALLAFHVQETHLRLLRWTLWAMQHDNERGASENAVLAFWSSKDVVSCDLYELC